VKFRILGIAQDAQLSLQKIQVEKVGALRVERAWGDKIYQDLKETIRQAKQLPVLINYNVGKETL
jgi:hypothetical protein